MHFFYLVALTDPVINEDEISCTQDVIGLDRERFQRMAEGLNIGPYLAIIASDERSRMAFHFLSLKLGKPRRSHSLSLLDEFVVPKLRDGESCAGVVFQTEIARILEEAAMSLGALGKELAILMVTPAHREYLRGLGCESALIDAIGVQSMDVVHGQLTENGRVSDVVNLGAIGALDTQEAREKALVQSR